MKYINDKGREVASRLVSSDDKKRDRLVNKLLARAGKLSRTIAKEKEVFRADLVKYLDAVAAKYGENWRGNATLYNYAKTKLVKICVSDTITFDEKLSIAKQKIDEYIKQITQGSKPEIVALVDAAFQVDKKRSVDPKQIFRLRQAKIKDTRWQEAMEIIADSVQIISTKSYLNFRERELGASGRLCR